jgi:hypothetical protein
VTTPARSDAIAVIRNSLIRQGAVGFRRRRPRRAVDRRSRENQDRVRARVRVTGGRLAVRCLVGAGAVDGIGGRSSTLLRRCRGPRAIWLALAIARYPRYRPFGRVRRWARRAGQARAGARMEEPI